MFGYQWNVVGGRVLICGVYLPPGDELAQQAFLSNLQAVILDHPDEKILILGDFNLPSIVWSPSRGNHLQPSVYDNKAIDFVNTVSYCNLLQFNSVINSCARILDLVLANDSSFVDSVTSCAAPLIKIDKYHPALDVVLKSIHIKRLNYIKPSFSYNKANYDVIRRELSCVDWVGALEPLTDIDAATSKFYSILNDIISKHVPLKK
ncbi:Endonuclease-reverse transcriptase [Popillia japonica]|uniref:Endonuclease-reverse transcriptase n=1 Tax=Popillia japonica TaxID=7064 RepID=A0AAW1HFZ6_POPJA